MYAQQVNITVRNCMKYILGLFVAKWYEDVESKYYSQQNIGVKAFYYSLLPLIIRSNRKKVTQIFLNSQVHFVSFFFTVLLIKTQMTVLL